MLITTSPFVKTYTLDEFWALPEPADRSKLELISGVLYLTPPPDELTHDPVTGMLIRLFTAEIIRLGDPGMLFSARASIWTYDRDTYLEPDIFYLTNESIERFAGQPRNTADLAIEVLSQSNRSYDRTTKADTYAAMGVRELWLVDPATRTVEVRYGDDRQWVEQRTFETGEQIVSRVLPEGTFSVADVFSRLR